MVQGDPNKVKSSPPMEGKSKKGNKQKMAGGYNGGTPGKKG